MIIDYFIPFLKLVANFKRYRDKILDDIQI